MIEGGRKMDGKLNRRAFLKALAVAGGGLASGLPWEARTASPLKVRMAITGGYETFWAYLNHEKEKLLIPSGYDVEFNVMQNPMIVQGMVSGGLDVGTFLFPLVGNLMDKGVPARFFLPIAWMFEGYVLAVPKDSPFKTVGDLKGKKLASRPPEDPSTWFAVVVLWKNYGVRLEKDFDLQPTVMVPQMLESGKADAGIVAAGQWAALKQTGKYRVLTTVADEWKKFSPSKRILLSGGYAAPKAFLEKNPKFVTDLIRLNYEAFKQYKKDKASILDKAAAEAKQTIAEAQSVAYNFGLDHVEPERMYIDPQDVKDSQVFFDLFAEYGLLKKRYNAEDLFYVSPKRLSK
jgi:ABC-type nitrate/sulfonate/bicarbonate transport system substrate-binding protein